MAAAARYDRIGHGYATRRHEDPDLSERIAAVVGDAGSVLNVGAFPARRAPGAGQC